MNTFTIILAILTLVLLAGFAFKVRQWVKAIRIDSNRIEDKLNQLQSQTNKSIESINRATQETVNAVCISSLGFQFPVFLGGPSIDTQHARALLFHLQERKPKRILELGSGSSTVIIARALQLLHSSPELHIAVDHELRFLNNTKELARANQVEHLIRFEHCPLIPIEGFPLPWYSRIPEIIGSNKLNLVVIDGPPAYADGEERAREPALSVLRPFLAESCVVLLDDANRPGEMAALQAWTQLFPEFKLYHMAEGKGVAILTLGE